MFGHRSDGYLIRYSDPIAGLIPHIMPERSDSQVMLTYEVDYAKLARYVVEKEGEGHKEICATCGLDAESGPGPGTGEGPSPGSGVARAKKESRKSAAHQLISRSDCFDFLNPLLLGAAEVASRRNDNRLVFLQPVIL